MMDVQDLPSDSDSSDEDFVPEGADSDLPSEEDTGPEDAELEAGAGSGDDVGKPIGRKRLSKAKKQTGRKRMKKSSAKEEEQVAQLEEEKASTEKLSEEDEKKKADSLWADFMKDVGGPIRKPSTSSSTVKAGNAISSSPAVKAVLSKPASTEKENKAESKVMVTKIFDFAGEKVEVTKEVAADSPDARLSLPNASGPSRGGITRGKTGGLSAVLSQIGKKSKISTLEKSKLDWERFKTDEGIQEEIQSHNRGKDGYLERQDFLERTDLRQFEIEKQLRTNRRSNR